MDVFIVQNRVIRLSKGLFRETYSVKELTFDPHIVYQSFNFTAELHLTRKQILFILEKLKFIRKSYDNVSKTLFIPYPIPKFGKTPSKALYFFISIKIFTAQNPVLSGLGSDFQRFALKSSSTLSYPLKSRPKSKNLTIYSKIKNFSLITHKKLNQVDESNFGNATCSNFPPFVTYIGNLSHFYSKQLLVIYFRDCFCVYFYLFGRVKSLNWFSDRIQLEQK